MRTETFVYGSISCTVGSATRRVPIRIAQFKEAIRSAYPVIAVYESELLSLVAPKTLFSMPDEKPMTPEERLHFLEKRQQEYEVYWSKVVAVQNRFATGYQLAKYSDALCPMLARINDVSEAPFLTNSHKHKDFTDEEVVTAFNGYLDEGDEPESFWKALEGTIDRIDKPLVPVEDRKPEALTQEQREDPLSVSVEVIANA